MLSIDLYFAFLAMGGAFAMWGLDKIFDIIPKKYTRWSKAFLGFFSLLLGALIVCLVTLAGHAPQI